jgi:hypothetical protein
MTINFIHDAITDAQNRGELCPHCQSAQGHTILCPTINRAIAEARSALNGNATEQDAILAHALGVKL